MYLFKILLFIENILMNKIYEKMKHKIQNIPENWHPQKVLEDLHNQLQKRPVGMRLLPSQQQ